MSDTNRGPGRWERAALNAARRPNSQAARLYRTRVAVATGVVEAQLFADVPYSYMQKSYMGLWGAAPEYRTKHRVCSMYCLVMDAQLTAGALTAGTTAFAGLIRSSVPVADGSTSSPWSLYVRTAPGEMKRVNHCFCCGQVIKVPK